MSALPIVMQSLLFFEKAIPITKLYEKNSSGRVPEFLTATITATDMGNTLWRITKSNLEAPQEFRAGTEALPLQKILVLTITEPAL